MSLRLFLAAALAANIALFALGARSEVPQSPAQPQPAATATPVYSIIRVRAPLGADINALAARFDVLEMRDGDDLFVQGTDATLLELRARGYSAEVHQTLDSKSGGIAPFTFYGGYRTVAEHFAHLDDVAAAYPRLAQVIDYGDSWRKVNNVPNGHDLKAICITNRKIGDCALTPSAPKPRFTIIASMHSRELSPAEVAWRWIDHLTTQYGVDPNVTWLLDHHEMWVIPLANPDGRLIVQSAGGPYLHRKNANTVDGPCGTALSDPDYGGLHPGIDLNRNGSWRWDPPVSASTSPCSAVFRGPGPISEPENYFLEDLLAQLYADNRPTELSAAAPLSTSGVFLTLHSFANMVLMPWSFTSGNPPNNAGLRALGFRMSHYNGYQTGQSPEILYGTSGSTDDWTYGELGIASYTYEVGPGSGGCAGFTPPYSCQTGFWNSNLPALMYAARAARAPYQQALGPTPLTVTTRVITGTASTTATLTVSTRFDDNAFGNSGVGRPAAQIVTAAELFVDTPPWAGGTAISMTLSDGVANSSSEAFTTSVPISNSVTAERRLVYVRGRDAAGNFGPVSAQWISTGGANEPAPTTQAISMTQGYVGQQTTVTVTTQIASRGTITITGGEAAFDQPGALDIQPIVMTPLDGAADSLTETFVLSLTLDTASGGVRTLYARGYDAQRVASAPLSVTVKLFPDTGAPGPRVETIALSPTLVLTSTQLTVTWSVSNLAGLPVTGTRIYLDTPSWSGGIPLGGVLNDGDVNSPLEVFTVTLPALPPWEHRIYIQGIDASGQTGPTATRLFISLPFGATQTYLPVIGRYR
jgi:carboxypeptidase T